MKYRIWAKKDYLILQRERFFGLLGWVWLDACSEWCNWYGKDHPKKFYSTESIFDFLENPKQKVIAEFNY